MQAINNLDLSIIVLSFNTKDITDECLTRLKKATDFCTKQLQNQIEVIVLDNASTDGSVEMIQKKHAWVKLLTSEKNTGFSGGNNIGMKHANNGHILLLNSDAYVEEDTLVNALLYFKNHPECDLLGCKLHFADGRFQPSAGFLPTPLNTSFWISGLARFPFMDKIAKPIHPQDKEFFKEVKQVEWVMGAFFMFKRLVYESTGGFDETIFMYGEEVEWCKRIKDEGFKMYYVPNFSITHLDKASSGFLLEKPLLNEIKGIVRYFKQHYRRQYGYVRAVIFLSLLWRIIVFTLMGNGQRRRAYKEALAVL